MAKRWIEQKSFTQFITASEGEEEAQRVRRMVAARIRGFREQENWRVGYRRKGRGWEVYVEKFEEA
jgi:hypothetical protein